MKFCVTLFTALLAFLAADPASARDPVSLLPAPDAPVAAASVQPGDEEARPALWKVADEDTTIYLFGTVHYLPEGTQWLTPSLSNALTESDEYVTEVDLSGSKQMAAGLYMLREGSLPQGTTLRDQLSAEDYELVGQALGKLNLRPDAMDRFKPWFAAVNLYLIAVMNDGYSAESGVESVLQSRMEGKARGELESIALQTAMFDTLPPETQRQYLVSVAQEIGSVTASLDDIVAKWREGDVDTLGMLINEGFADPVLAEALLYARNRNWAVWIDDRLDRPGTVFVAVGAGHLAGEGSVQSALSARGIAVARVQ